MAPLTTRAPGAGRGTPPRPPGAAPHAARDAGAWPFALAVLAAALVVLATQYGWAPRLPFLNDDHVFLDRTRALPFADAWAPRELLAHWWRPWSRELHYWALQRAFGTNEAPFHVVSLAQLAAVLVAYALLARRLAGGVAAAIATAGLAAMAAWALPAAWVAGAQDLWMLLFALLALHATASGRPVWAAIACAFALLSKETAAVLPAVCAALLVARGATPGRALRATAAAWLALVAWAAVHPLLGGRLLHPVPAAAGEPVLSPGVPAVFARTLLALASLDAWPRPLAGWGAALLVALPAAAALAALVVFAARRGDGAPGPPTGARAAAFGGAWAVLAWLPLFAPAIGWHAYYALLGACGAWLALGVALARRPAAAAALVVALAVVRGARATTPSLDWGTEFYQVRAAAFMAAMRADLLRLHPTLPPGSRLFFTRVPSQVGFLAGDGPALRTWYDDPTLRGTYVSRYTARRPDERGSDYFFRYDGARWVEIAIDASTPVAADAASDVRRLAEAFAAAGDWARAAAQYDRLAAADPGDPRRAVDAAVARAMVGDSAAATRRLDAVLATPGTPDSLRRTAADLRRELGGR